MRRIVAWLTGAAGGLAAYRALARRRPAEPLPEAGPDPRAEELRARLAEARAADDGRDELAAVETPVDEAEPPPDPDARRRAVHEQGRAAIDEMRGVDS